MNKYVYMAVGAVFALIAAISASSFAAQSTIRDEGAFTYESRTRINNNFTELYNSLLSGVAGIVTTTISATTVTLTGDLSGDGGDQLYGFLQDQVASTTTSTTAAQCGKTFVSNSADVMTLPEASTVLGCKYTFVCGTADDFDINPADGTDQIGTVASITGTNTTTVLAPSAGDAIRCTDIGSSIVIEAVGADLWVSVGNANGIWTDVN